LGDTITLTTAKLTSKLKAEASLGAVRFVRHRSLKSSFTIGIVLFAIASAMSPLFARFLHMDSYIYPIVVFSSFMFAFPLSTDFGTMQGLQRFLPYASVRVLWALLRPALAILLVTLGFALVGGLAAIPLSYALTLVVTFALLSNLPAGNEKVETQRTVSYAGLVFVALFSVTMLTNIDVVLAKHYLPPDDAGSYSAISVLGRICLYAPTGVALAMFPKTSESFESGGRHRSLFIKAAFLSIMVVAPICLIYALFPTQILHILFSDKYSLAAPYIFKYGLGMSFLALSYLAMTYSLSIGKTGVAYCMLGAMLLQLSLIACFHSSIAQLVNAMLISGIVSLLLLLTMLFIGKHALRQTRPSIAV
jgi:O-antigen/teichoic acid export membrane protein